MMGACGFPSAQPAESLLLPSESGDAYGDRLDVVLEDFFGRVRAAGVRDDAVSTWPAELRQESSEQFVFVGE